jgi:hypothetical protein
VYPGSHHLLEQHFAAKGTAEVERLGHDGLPRNLPFAEPQMVTGCAGVRLFLFSLLFLLVLFARLCNNARLLT